MRERSIQKEKPTHWAVWQAENEPVVDGGNPPRPFRHFRMAERCSPDQIFESSPRSFGVGSKIGYHHHQLRRPAFQLDAREKTKVSQVGSAKKLAFDLPDEQSPGELA
jgi:hypothetical protein